jgi:glucose/arabinose dehydrogenase
MSRRLYVLGVLGVVMAFLGACGGGGASKSASSTGVTRPVPLSTTGETSTSPSTANATSTNPPAPPGPTVPPVSKPAVTGAPNNCAVAGQAPPSGTIAANFATALAFAPDGRLFFTERSGTVRVFQGGQSKVFATVNTVTTERDGGGGERGLLGLAIDPNFNQNRFVYAFYSDADYVHQDVIRWSDCAGTGTAARILVVLPSGGDCCHKGGRLAFGPDGKLYVTLGEEHTAPAAQDTTDVRGKVLRYNADGSVPSDNPFGRTDPVWIYGLRNPFGIAFSPGGQLAITNNGPSGDIPGGPATGYDTVIFAAPKGAGYQWPNCYGYGSLLPGKTSCGVNELGPDWSSESTTVIPTGATFVDQAGPAGYAGKLLVCTYARGMLIFTPGTPHGSMTMGSPNCKLDVKEGPNHALYVSDDSSISRIG